MLGRDEHCDVVSGEYSGALGLSTSESLWLKEELLDGFKSDSGDPGSVWTIVGITVSGEKGVHPNAHT